MLVANNNTTFNVSMFKTLRKFNLYAYAKNLRSNSFSELNNAYFSLGFSLKISTSKNVIQLSAID